MILTRITQKIETAARRSRGIFGVCRRYYEGVVEKEAMLADITEHDRVLCIGGGPCPLTAIMLHQHTGAAVTVVDNCPHCVAKAKSMVRRMGVDLQVKQVDGRMISPADYTVIHIAKQVSPLRQVLSHILSNITDGTRILVRRPKKDAREPSEPHVHHSIGTTLLYL
jgi:protein-L-isoaspartate O-methyltransferase